MLFPYLIPKDDKISAILFPGVLHPLRNFLKPSIGLCTNLQQGISFFSIYLQINRNN